MRKIIKKNIYKNFLVKLGANMKHDSSVKIPIRPLPYEGTKHLFGDVPQIFIFHHGNLKAPEWRELKNKLAKMDAVIINQPNYCKDILSKNKMSVNIPVGPSVLLCLKKDNKQENSTFKILQTIESFSSKNLILLYGQSNFTILNHKDIQYIANFHSIKGLFKLLSNNLLFASVDFFSLLNLKCS